ncbi:MAG: acyl-CoA thioesterase [Deltaproteobacteria bacterium]|nr:acyl-CoA thioesterase [Deltaproteobacteria bacterium]MBM4390478.1 acyl-CoA thioesterase [Deltaproteobacteria bacterium]
MPERFPGITIRVPSSHIDMFGHCNHARYLEYFEWARFAWAAHGGSPIPEMVKNGLGPAILRADVRYRRECLYDDELHVSVEPLSARRDIGRLRQVITRTADNEVVAEAEMTFVMIDLVARKATKLPAVFLTQVGR